MNKLLDFFSSLLPTFERSTITQDVDSLRTLLQENAIKPYKTAAGLTHGDKFRSPLGQSFQANFQANFPQLARPNFLAGTLKLLDMVEDQLKTLSGLVPSVFGRDVTRETMTYRRASLIRYLEILRFVVTYAAAALNRVAVSETAALSNNLAAVDNSFTPGEIRWFQDNFAAYMQAIALVISPAPNHDLQKILESIPDIVIVPEAASQVKTTIGQDNLDPLKLGLISASKNPIYHFRLRLSEFQHREYEAKLEERRLLQYRITAWKEAYAQKEDPKLAKAIEWSTGRLQRLESDIREMAADYA